MLIEHTIYGTLKSTAERFGSRNALGSWTGTAYSYLTYNELLRQARRLRRSMYLSGLRRGDRVGIFSENRPEWVIADLAAQAAGLLTVPIYSTLPAAQAAHILADSGARMLFVSGSKLTARAAEARQSCPDLQSIVAFDADARGADMSLDALLETSDGHDELDNELEAAADAADPDEIATLIYTSGTTGAPKGAMLSHRNLLHTGMAARSIVRLDEQDVFLSFAPLCHIVERTGGYYLPLICGALIVYSQGPFTLAAEFERVQPTIFLCVPRVYEAMQGRLEENVAKAPPRRRRLFNHALAIGSAAAGTGLKAFCARLLRPVADKLVLAKVRAKLTGGRMRFLVSGGAPLAESTARFYQALGLTMLEGYGLTECPVISLNRPGSERPGSVGQVLPGLEVELAGDGEILAKGPSLMQGYFGDHDPGAAHIDSDGWLHTGDVATMSADGFIKITDRKKDILVLANGKNVAPQPIEAALKASPYIAETVLFGDGGPAVVALVTPQKDRLTDWAKQHHLSGDWPELLHLAEVDELYKKEIARLTLDLADYEKIKRFALLDAVFSVESGELTPTLKVRRKAVAGKYTDILSGLIRKG